MQRRNSAALGAFERTRPMVAAQAIGIASEIQRLVIGRALRANANREPLSERLAIPR